MKKNAAPELSSKWWSAQQPDGLLAAAELDKALSAYEAAQAKLQKDHNAANNAACAKALDQVESAAKKVADEAGKAEKSPPKKAKSEPEEYGYTADALKKLPRLVADARKALEDGAKAAAKANENDEDEDGEGLLANEKEYQAYLKKSLRRLMNVPLNFAVGLGKQPDEHRLLFHKAKTGRAMMATIKAGTELKKLSFGIAGAHAEKTGVLTLGLEGMQLPGLKKKLERLLKHFKPLPFNKIMLMVDGEEAEDILDPEDTTPDEDAETVSNADASAEASAGSEPPPDLAAEFKARLAALLPAIQQAVAAQQPAAAEAKLKASEAGVLSRKQDFAAALRLLDEAHKLLAAAPTSASSAAPGSDADGRETALSRWRSTRGEVIAKLKEVAKEVAGAKHAESKTALLEINAVIKNLSAEPDTAQKVAELQRWVEQDDVVADVSEFAEDIRSPLLAVLDELKTALAA